MLQESFEQGPGPEDVHDRVDPHEVLHRPSQCPEHNLEEEYICRVLAVGVCKVQDDRVHSHVYLDRSEDGDYQPHVVQGLSLDPAAEDEFSLVFRDLLLIYFLANEPSESHEADDQSEVEQLEQEVVALGAQGRVRQIVLFHSDYCKDLRD